MSKKTGRYQSDDSSLPLVIVNPKSASGSTMNGWAAKASDLRTHFGPFSAAFTKKQGDGIQLARRAAESGRKFILACGGDGTINEVANGIVLSGCDAELGIIPSGTGGDFRRTIKMPASVREIARSLRLGVTKTIDVGKVTFIDHQGGQAERFFLNVASFGLAASVLERVKGGSSLAWVPNGTLRGRAAFALSTLQEIIGVDAVQVRIKVDDGDERTVQTINFCVANGRFFGGGMMIAPDARLADGLFNIVNIGDIGTARILMNAYTLYRGTHTALTEVKVGTGRRITAFAPDENAEVRLETDGELPGRLPATFEIVPAALRLRVPHGA